MTAGWRVFVSRKIASTDMTSPAIHPDWHAHARPREADGVWERENALFDASAGMMLF